jgi:regulation of enolase protein 1 (concanavalin A-like superfamily)
VTASHIFVRATAVLGLLLTSFVAACSGSDGGDQFAGIVSDDFHTGVLDTQLWNIVDPQGDGTVELVGAGTPDAQLRLSVPAGTTHDAWTSNTTLRAMQPATNDDLEVEVKFESEPTQQYQGQGLLVEQDPSNYVRFDVYSDGNSLRVFGATFSNGSATIRVNSSIASGPTTYLRMARSGNQWTAQYSYDGSSWSTAASFSHALTVSSVGVFAANFNPNPAYTAVVDYFYETSAPIASEDPPLCDPADALVLTTQATNGVIVRNPDQSSYSCGDVVTLTAQPNVGATFLGWGGALSGTANPEVLTINADTTVTASFDLDTTAPLVSNVNVTASQTSAVVSWQTNELSVGTVEYGLTTAYGLGPVSSSTLSTAHAHAVTLPGLIEGQVYHYRITTADSLNNSATGADATFTTTSGVCVLTTQATNGVIVRNPDQSSYSCGDAVTLTAQPNVGATFVGWGGALSGTANPEVLTLNANTTVVANFALDTTPPQISNVNVSAGETSATVNWQTDELSIGFVEYGLTTAYGLGSVSSSTFSTAHAVTLPGLIAGQVYHYRITAEDSVGNGAAGADATFTTSTSGGGTGGAGGGGGPIPGAILSDDFHTGVLDTQLWEVVDPQGDGTVELVGAGTADAQLRLSVPAGTTHDAWTSNTTLRAMQPAADGDFEIEVKFESEPTQQYQGQGLLVEQDPSNYVRFDVYSDGSTLKVFSATFNNGAPTIRVNSAISAGPTTYLRLARSGNQWTARYSYDGSSWTTATSFSHALTVWSVGVFAANFNPNPAYTAVVDYFFDTASPIDPEDGAECDPADQFTLATSSIGPGTVIRDPDQSSYACSEWVTLTAQPDAGAAFLGWGEPPSASTNPLSLRVGADTTLTANFEFDTTAPQVSNVNVTVGETSATVSWQTDEVSTGFAEFGLTTAYELGPVASSTPSTTHAAGLPGLIEGEVYHYRITAVDSFGNSVTGADATFTATGGGPLIDVWYGDSQSFGFLGDPQRWVNVLGQVSDPDGLTVLTYSLNGGPPQNLSVGPFRRLSQAGDFNVEFDYQQLPAGTNTIQIRAVDGLGFESTKTVTVDYSVGNVWPLGYQVDWSSANEISDVAQVVDGRWSIVGGELRNDLQAYDRLVAIGDLSWTDYEVTVPVTVHGISSAGFGGVNGAPGLAVFLKWTGHFDWDGSQPTYGYYPIGGGGWVSFASDGSGSIRLEDFTPGGIYQLDPLGRIYSIGTRYIWKVRVETLQDGTALYRMKVWVDGSPEPADWEFADIDTGDVSGGSLALIAHFTDVSFGNVVISPL